MRRLREQAVVTLSPSEERGRPVRCWVAAVGHAGAALLPMPGETFDVRGVEGDWYLVFHAGPSLIALRGRVECRADRDVRFRPTDGVQVSRRGAARLTAEQPITLDGRETTTVNLSSDGVLVADPGGIELGATVPFALPLGDDAPAIEGSATAVRLDAGRLALTLDDLPGTVRERIDEHVIAVQRERLLQQAAHPPRRLRPAA